MEAIEAQDFFGSVFRIVVQPYAGLDFSKKCFVFPGQGSLPAGTGHAELQRFEILRRRFNRADSLAKSQNLIQPSVFVENPQEIPAAQNSLSASLALFTMSVGLYEVLLARGERPHLITSHSFGEYAAYVASGIVGFEDMFQIVAARESFCPPANALGSMIAVSADAETLRQTLEPGLFFIANANSPRQTILSLAPANVKPVLELLRRKRLPAKVLDRVFQPYHSPLMAEAQNKFFSFLQNSPFVFRSPMTPLLSSLSGEMITKESFSDQKVRLRLAEQLTRPVDFISQIRSAIEMGTRHFVEVSLNPASGPWISQILEGQPHRVTLPAAFQVEATTAVKKISRPAHDSKLVGILNKVISSVTGYSVAEISLSKNFQEDLGIDSIKKAQIILNFLEGQGGVGGELKDGIAMNRIRTIEDVLNWYAHSQSGGAGREEAAQFSLYRQVWVEHPPTNSDLDFSQMAVPSRWISVGDFAAGKFESPGSSPENIVFFDDGHSFNFSEWLAQIRKSYPSWKMVSAETVVGLVIAQSSSPETKAIEGFLRSLCKEISCGFQIVQLDEPSSLNIRPLVERELAALQFSPVRHENGRRLVLENRRAESAALIEAPISVAAIGGGRGITFEILKSLVRRGTKSVSIMGRRPAAETEANLSELKRLGAEVQYHQGDCCQASSLEEFLRQASANGPLALTIHGGGIEYSALAGDQSDDQARQQLETKSSTVRLLAGLSKKFALGKIICFSSTAGEFGNAGQSVYAYANMLMTFQCENLHNEGLPICTIAWPAWKGLGMTERDHIAQQLRLSGLHLLEGGRGCELFGEFLSVADNHRLICMDSGFSALQRRENLRLRALKAVFPSLNQLRFPIGLNEWTIKDLPALRDHMIMDQSVVPVSFPLTVFWHLGLMLTGQSFKIADVEAISFMVLHRRDSPYLLDCYNGPQGLALEIRSNQTHVRARLAPAEPSDLKVPAYRETAGFSLIDMFKQSYARFGADLHLLENVRVTGDDKAFAEVNCDKHVLYSACGSVNRQLVLFEALFHLSGACSEAKTGRLSVPLSFQSVVVNNQVPLGNRFRLMVQCRYPTADVLEADLYAYTESGECYLAIKGEKLRLFNEIQSG